MKYLSYINSRRYSLTIAVSRVNIHHAQIAGIFSCRHGDWRDIKGSARNLVVGFPVTKNFSQMIIYILFGILNMCCDSGGILYSGEVELCRNDSIGRAILGLYSRSGRTQDRATSRSREIRVCALLTALKFDMHLCSSAAEMSVKLQSDTVIITSNIAASRLHEILR